MILDTSSTYITLETTDTTTFVVWAGSEIANSLPIPLHDGGKGITNPKIALSTSFLSSPDRIVIPVPFGGV